MSALTLEPEFVELAIGDAQERWQAIGFDVRWGMLDIGGVRLRFTGTDGGIRSWALRSQDNTGPIDGLQTTMSLALAAAVRDSSQPAPGWTRSSC